MTKQPVKRRRNLDMIFLYIILLLTSGFHNLSGELVLTGCIGVSFLIILKQKKYMKISMEQILLLLFMLMSVILFFWINGESIKQIIITGIFILISFIYTLAYRIEDFMTLFVKLIMVISVSSLFFYLMALFLPNMLSILPEVRNPQGVKAYFGVFTFIRLTDNLLRNQGIFWEPGAFQTFLNIALLITLFSKKFETKIRNYYTVILYIALITTFSTTGYATGIVLLVTFFLEQTFSNKNINKNKHKSIMFIVFIIFLSSVIYLTIPLGNKYQVFSKLDELENPSSNMLSSTSVRLNAIKYTFLTFLNNPIIGVGYTKLSEIANIIGFKMFTNTPMNWLTIFGILLGTLYNFGIILFATSFSNKISVKIGLLLTILLSITTEEYSRNPSILIFALYFYTEYFSCYRKSGIKSEIIL